jgi:multidrug resistance efflux pump
MPTITPAQLTAIQNDVATLTTCVNNDNAAQAAVSAAQTQISADQQTLNTAQSTAQSTAAAVSAAGAQLDTDVNAAFPPSPPASTN